MKTALLLMVVLSTPIICAVFARLLALRGLDGWGWFLVIALLTTGTTVYSRDDDDE